MKRALLILAILACAGCGGPEAKGHGKGFITSYSYVNAWVDDETGKRYLVFESVRGISVIEAPLTVEKK